MRQTFTAFALAVLCAAAGCTTLHEAYDVAVKLSRPPSPGQVEAMLKANDANFKQMDTQLEQMKASGHQPSQAEINNMVSRAIDGKHWANRGEADAEQSLTQLPADQEISINILFDGTKSLSTGKVLDFKVRALWGDYKVVSKDIHLTAAGKGEAKFDLGESTLRVIPRLVGGQKGEYTVELSDKSGALLGRFAIKQTGQQVGITGHASKYESTLAYFLPEDRLTAYQINHAGSRQGYVGVVFIGKGYTYVESAKQADLSKGYLFPEVNLVVLPSGWMKYNDIADTRQNLKQGRLTHGGIVYSAEAPQS